MNSMREMGQLLLRLGVPLMVKEHAERKSDQEDVMSVDQRLYNHFS
jgi:hypothetical protein